MDYFVRADEHTYMTQSADPEDSWSRPSYGLHLSVTGISRTNPNSGRDFDVTAFTSDEDIPAGAEALVVVVKYGDGDTFGNDEYWTVTCITQSQAKALDAVDAANAPATKDYTNWRPWDGYFAWLDEVYVETFTMGA